MIRNSVEMQGPFLEHYPEKSGPVERVAVVEVPFTLGRAETHHRTVYSQGVSRDHAEIFRIGEGYAIRDLGSTNGTFVNGRRITQAILNDGDIVHLAQVEFCFHCRQEFEEDTPCDSPTVAATQALPLARHDSVIRGARLLRELINTKAVCIAFQPIVDLRTRAAVAYEALGRGTHPELPLRPGPLLQLAEQCGMAIELSQLFRQTAVTEAARLEDGSTVFLNVHPRELVCPDFLRSLQHLQHPSGSTCRFVLEIAEASITDVSAMARHRTAFNELGFEFAYDDFGAGQARLLELSDIPPHYLKLDIGLIQGIESLKPRQDVVRALLGVVSTLGVRVIAEGIETEAVAQVCRELGCHLGQGFLFGYPG